MALSKYLFFDTLKACEQRINEIDRILHPDWIDGITETYMKPEKHPTKEIWALCIDESFVHLFSDSELENASEKDDSWIVKMEMI